jgi:DMSO/TMAO reductase YedYZ molybdopterin-dependent catalytic subunit
VTFPFNYQVIETRRYEYLPITPSNELFTTSIDFFEIDPETYLLTITGAVNNSLSLTLDEIKSMPAKSEIVRQTCIEYTFGATHMTGIANFTGVQLSHVLNLVEIDFNVAIDISFHTPDPEGYSTSLNLTEAFWDDVLLAYEMNGETMPIKHGFPLKLVCPRFYGYKWIKWISTIIVRTVNYKGYWESYGYDDSPFVDIDLPTYYTYTSNITPITNMDTSKQISILGSSVSQTPWLTIDVLMVYIAVLIVGNRIIAKYLRKRKHVDS